MMHSSLNYHGYFRNHVKFDFTQKGLEFESQFVTTQLDLIEKVTEIRAQKQGPILEIGSGFGRLYYLLQKRGYSGYEGLEPDSEACTFATKTFGPIFHQNYLHEFKPELKGYYKSIFSFETLEHLSDPISAINRIYDLLAPGGIFIGTSPFPCAANVLSDQTHLFVLHPENWRRLFVRAGFTEISTRAMTFIPFLWRINEKWNRILPFYFPFFRFVSTSLIIAHKPV